MNSQTMLVVDDDDKIREIIGLYFAKEGFQVEDAADGVKAFRKVEQVKSGVIILDIIMPVLDGIEVCRQGRLCVFSWI